MSVEVFRTNLERYKESEILLLKLKQHFPDYLMNMDMEDCDKILRVEGKNILSEQIIKSVIFYGYNCEELPDQVWTSLC